MENISQEHENSIIATKATIRNFKGVEYDPNDPKFENLSKRGIKKLLRTEQYNATKDQRKLAQREKTRVKRAERRKKVRDGLIEATPTKKRLASLSQQTDVGLVIDCGFSDLMIEKELFSFANQLSYSYGKNRTASQSMKLSLTSVDDPLRNMLNSKLPSWKEWKNVSILESTYLDQFDKNDLVYLSADSENVITELEQGKQYIVGGIVDKNRYKNLCLDKAMKQDIQTARLPITNYIQMATRKVLTVNQVCEIMLKWLELGDWQQAFLNVIPDRKLKDVVSKSVSEENNQEEDSIVDQEESKES